MKPLSERSLDAGRDRLQAIVDSAMDGLITIDKRGIVETFNPACERIFGYDAEEVIGQNIKMLMPEPYHAEHDGYLRNYQATHNPKIIGTAGREVSGKRKDGSVFPLELSVSSFDLWDGSHYCGIIRDVTDRRNAEGDRQQLMEKLMRSNTELERFAYVASHDMQEPVRMVINFSKILAQDYNAKLDDEGREYLDYITKSADRIHDMIDDLLDYARLGSEDNGMCLVDGASELSHVLHNLDALIKESGARITYDALPAFHGNPVQFMRLMQNLISNAIKYRSPHRAPEIHIGVEDDGCAWRLSVTDNGMGVDEAFTKSIFEPFRRLHSWEQIKGTGLGLAVCKKIVENHDGKIWMNSVPGEGSTFFVTLRKECAESRFVA